MFRLPRRAAVATAICGLSLLAVAMPAAAQPNGTGQFRAQLSGLPQVPSVLTTGHGTFSADLTDRGTTLTYELTYADLSGPASMAHIHFGQAATNGGVIVPLCGTADKPCPGSGGTVRGTISADDVQAIAAQGVAAGDFQGLVTALRNGATYVNVHTAAFGEGEIRGQIRQGGGSDPSSND